MSPAIVEFRRAALEARIEELIALLDLIDGEPDLEEDIPAEDDDPPEDGGDGFVPDANTARERSSRGKWPITARTRRA